MCVPVNLCEHTHSSFSCVCVCVCRNGQVFNERIPGLFQEKHSFMEVSWSGKKLNSNLYHSTKGRNSCCNDMYQVWLLYVITNKHILNQSFLRNRCDINNTLCLGPLHSPLFISFFFSPDPWEVFCYLPGRQCNKNVLKSGNNSKQFSHIWSHIQILVYSEQVKHFASIVK